MGAKFWLGSRASRGSLVAAAEYRLRGPGSIPRLGWDAAHGAMAPYLKIFKTITWIKCFLGRRVDDCSVQFVAGASHWVQQDAPDIVNERIRAYLQS